MAVPTLIKAHLDANHTYTTSGATATLTGNLTHAQLVKLLDVAQVEGSHVTVVAGVVKINA